MIRSNFQTQQFPKLNFLSQDEIYELHLASLEILERTGVSVFEEESLSLLKKAGAKISGKNRVRIPSYLVNQALQSAPPRIAIADRDGKRCMFLEDHKVYYGTGSDCPMIIDPISRERRKSVIKDVENAALICDYLSNIDFVMSFGLASDVPQPISDRYQFKAMVSHTEKPIVFIAWDKKGLSDIVDMASMVAGSLENLQQNPFIILYCEVISPLKHAREPLEKLLFCAEKNIPIIYTTGGMAGATMPVTLAGALAVANAEILSALVIHQLKKPGAPFIYGGTLTIFDMKTMRFSNGAPEFFICNAALTEMANYYHLPMWGAAGLSDAKSFDQQAGIEAAYTILMTALSGTNLVHDIGYLESSTTGSYEMVVACDEIIGMIGHILKGIEVTPESLALDVIDEVGPGGSYLAHEHTVKHFRNELWFPQLIDRSNYQAWVKAGEKSLGARANSKVNKILREYSPQPLSPPIKKELETILRKA